MNALKDMFRALWELITEYVKSRIFTVTVIILVLFGLLTHRLFVLQIREGVSHTESFNETSEKTRNISAIRGDIYDVNGKLLAYNKVSYTLTFANDIEMAARAESLGISENELKNQILNDTITILENDGDKLDNSFPISLRNGNPVFTISGSRLELFLRDVYAVPSLSDLTEEQKTADALTVFEYLRDEVFSIDSTLPIERQLQILGCRYNLWLNRFQQYVSIEIAHDISEKSRAVITENKDTLLGMDMKAESLRVYNDAKYFSYIIGYVGTASEEDIEYYAKQDESVKYDSEDVVGKTGVEQVYELQLHGTDGVETLSVDNMGKVLEVKSSTPAVAGNDVYLSIDADLQKYCYDILEKEIAEIIVRNTLNIAFPPEQNDKNVIAITDVYAGLFANHQLKINLMGQSGATDLERDIYRRILARSSSVAEKIRKLLTDEPENIQNLSEEYKDYMEYICEKLRDDELYLRSKVPDDDPVFQQYVDGSLSLKEFLQHLIAIEAIDVTSIEETGTYYDSDDIYNLLREHIISSLESDEEFQNKMIRYMIGYGEILGSEVIQLLYDQGILNKENDTLYDEYTRGMYDSYSFILKKIETLEITPQMLAIPPCSGSIIVTDVHTGEERAYVSYPSYDNNYLTNSVDPDYYDMLLHDKTSPLYNRASMMRIAPGSTYKIVSTIAGVNEGVIAEDSVITDLGEFEQVFTKPRCWIYNQQHITHGSVGISEALDVSCNYFYYTVGYRLADDNGTYNDSMGLASLRKYAEQFGLGEESGFELPEISPHISDSDAVLSAIGQGTNNFAPIQLSKYITGIANSGTVYNPTLLSKITDYQGNTIMTAEHSVYSQVNCAPSLWERIHYGMRLVVTDDLEDIKLLNSLSVSIAGKTGTAQESEDMPTHSLFLSYAPYENPDYAMTAIIQNGYSSRNAAELSSFVYAYMYEKEALIDMEFNKNNVGGD